MFSVGILVQLWRIQKLLNPFRTDDTVNSEKYVDGEKEDWLLEDVEER